MKNLLISLLTILLISIIFISKVSASENSPSLNTSANKISTEYVKNLCIAREENLFNGLEKEKTLKYSYLRYIGLSNIDILTKDMYKSLINQIKEQCRITNEEESELFEFLKNEFEAKGQTLDQ